jgi:D-serine deaminase-like pyridoxal phosphate-dependent protein
VLKNLPTPCLLLDLSRFERNVRRLKSHLEPFAVMFRPHLKTAKNVEIARRVMATPQGPAMVSTLREAEYYASHGVKDLVYGVGIAPAKLDHVSMIRESLGAEITVVLDSIQHAEAVTAWSLSRNARLTAMIEIDCDGSRAGVTLTTPEKLIAIAHVLVSGGVELRGVMTHAGTSYDASDAEDLAAAAEAERQAVVHAANILRGVGLPCPIVSVGSTPTACSVRDLTGVNEVRAGVYMFGDLVQCGIGTCTVGDIAISVLATVIGHRHHEGLIIVDAGWMALSRDRGTRSQAVDQGYGLVCDVACEPFPNLLVLDTNQEHGIVGIRPGSGASLPDLPIGSLVRILPNHACTTSAQHETYQVLSSEQVQARWARVHGW